jgi:glucan 1,3-beta-glucosidase
MSPYWLERIPHRGRAAFNQDPDAYAVFRNVKDYGARGDGTVDDTAAIMAAMASGGRCGGGNQESTTYIALFNSV